MQHFITQMHLAYALHSQFYWFLKTDKHYSWVLIPTTAHFGVLKAPLWTVHIRGTNNICKNYCNLPDARAAGQLESSDQSWTWVFRSFRLQSDWPFMDFTAMCAAVLYCIAVRKGESALWRLILPRKIKIAISLKKMFHCSWKWPFYNGFIVTL